MIPLIISLFRHSLNSKPYHGPAALLVENGKFLLSAKRTRRTTCTEYIISMDAETISRSSSTYIGKLRYDYYLESFVLLPLFLNIGANLIDKFVPKYSIYV